MNWKKLLNMILFPHFIILIILLPVSIASLVYSFCFQVKYEILAYASYVISAYTLTIWCCRIPDIIRIIKKLKENNKYIKRWFNDIHLRVNVSLYGGFIWNIAYALLQIGLGFTHKSFWFFSLATYYLLLAIMRFFLAKHTSKFKPGECMKNELKKYRNCGIVFFLMNVALSFMIFFMVYWNRTFNHSEITTIALAAYTFTSLTMAVINVIKYRKYDSPVYSASKIIGLAAACVSMLTLESTMLNTFNDGTMTDDVRQILLGVSGAVLSVFVISTAIYMINQSTKRLKKL